jgi:maternal-effect protein exuperantia
MPLMNLNPGARQRHQIRVITSGFFRMLKSMHTYRVSHEKSLRCEKVNLHCAFHFFLQVIKTKTEIATLVEFLAWLEKVKGDMDGIIFVYHETQKLIPYMMIETMKKYNLTERFEKVVKSFVNGYDLFEEQKSKGLKYLTLYQNYRVLAEHIGTDTSSTQEFEGDAAVRAKLSYEICSLKSRQEMSEVEEKESMNAFILPKAKPISSELSELAIMEESLDRQTGMRDIFITYFSTSRYYRRRALTYRRVLADDKQDKDTLKTMWENGKREGIEAYVKELESIKEEDREELVNIIDHYFDPEKKPFKPAFKNRREMNPARNMRRRRRSNGPRMQNDNRGGRSNSRRRNRNRSNRRRDGNIDHEMKTGMPQQPQQQHQQHGTPQMIAVA